MSTATITSKGQVTIPKDVRDRLGLKEGDKIAFLPQGADVVEIRRKRPISDLFGCIPYDGPPITDQDIDVAIAETLAEKHGLR